MKKIKNEWLTFTIWYSETDLFSLASVLLEGYPNSDDGLYQLLEMICSEENDDNRMIEKMEGDMKICLNLNAGEDENGNYDCGYILADYDEELDPKDIAKQILNKVQRFLKLVPFK